ncbi:MAG: type I pantothenate kinase [Oenococcus oeni]|uniref:type I pantothenate kinase n=1 Tax=Oenococcus oeni TaxID=1247 RepID=UPI0010B58BE1|nr:type I pantothenate kinase [Oenococcus oeni]SYW02108.1 Type I pantothenate kinase [Oenococcus oeni]
MRKVVDEVLKRYKARWENFFVIALTGSVSVGKSTISQQLSDELKKSFPGLTTAIISVDSFIFSNEELKSRGIFSEKGFPKSYDLKALSAALFELKNGSNEIKIPVYSQAINNIAAGEFETIKKPKILIVEGVCAFRIDNYDLSIYVDADEKLIYQWFLKRTLSFIRNSKDDPNNFYYQFSKMPIPKIMPAINQTWEQTDLRNLTEFIEPMKKKADIVIHKTKGHRIDRIIIN